MNYKNMTTFLKNPYAEVRKKINFKIFNTRLDKCLKEKFKHKTFSERFATANFAFISMGIIAQLASLITAFTMLSYLFVGINFFVRTLCSVALVLMIEMIKRDSTNDVMKGISQYKEVERFPAILTMITVVASIYISIEGAKILPTLLISDPVKVSPTLAGKDGIISDFNSRLEALTLERDQHRKNRLYQGRLARKDSKVIEKYNQDIKELLVQKDEALKALTIDNNTAIKKAENNHKERIQQIQKERTILTGQLVGAAVAFEVLFLLSMSFSWWYYSECQKEREGTAKVTAETPTNKGVETLEVQEKTLEVQEETLAVNGEIRSKKMSFIDYEDIEQEEPPNIEKIKKDYTRICLECGTPFVHKTHNHVYCKRSCMLAARAKREEEKKSH